MQAPLMQPGIPTNDTLRSANVRVPGYAYTMTALAVVSIWVCVALASIFSPNMITGSQHEHLPIVAFIDWLWGGIATVYVLSAALEGIKDHAANLGPWTVLGIGVAVVWAAVVLVSIFTPYYVTGTDPTSIPFGAMLSPIVGMIVTWGVCAFVKAAYELQRPER